MQSEPGPGQDKSVLKLKVMIIDTSQLRTLLEDKDFDGITLQLSQAIGIMSPGNNTRDEKHKFSFIAYKHFSSKKKQEQISDSKFFINNNGTEIYKDVEIGGDGVVSHFGNLKLRREDMEEDIDTNEYPYLVLSPDHGTGEYENYIVCNASYTNNLNSLTAQPQALSRGLSSIKSTGSKVIKPSPPA